MDKNLYPFKRALTRLINSENMEDDSNTPDYILAQYLSSCLAIFEVAVNQRERWHKRDCMGTPEETVE